MRQVSVTTRAGSHEYSVTYQEFETLDEVRSTVDGGEDAILGIINASQRQNALQGPKAEVLKAVKALETATATGDEAEIASAEAALNEAEEAAREATGNYIIGRPRGGTGGKPTKKAQASLGEAITQYVQDHGKPPSQAEMARIMAELNIAM